MLTEALIVVVVSVLAWLFLNERKRHAKYPSGPYGLPFVGIMPFLGNEPHKPMSKMVEKYGTVFSCNIGGWDTVVLNDYKHVREVCKDDAFTSRPPFDLYQMFSGAGRDDGKFYGVAFNNGPVWNNQRRFVLRNLRDLGFGKQGMEDMITNEVQEVIRRLKTSVGQPICVEQYFALAIINALWTLITSERFKHDDPKLLSLTQIVTENFSEINMVGKLYFMSSWYKAMPKITGWKKISDAVDDYRDFFKDTIARHQATFKSESARDFIDLYLQEIKETTDTESSYYEDVGLMNLTTIIMEFFLAGIETTSSTIAWGCLYLTMNPEVQKKIHEEIDRVVGDTRLPNLLDRPRMPYLEATLWEILRYSANVPFSVHRYVTQDTEFNGYFLPKDTVILVNMYHVFFDKSHWGDPENFRPERFLAPDGSLIKDEAFLPFAIGKRVCPGETLARNQLFLFMSAVLQSFTIQLAGDKKPCLNSRKPGMVLHPKPFEIIMKERAVHVS